jgi:hypothetical protein
MIIDNTQKASWFPKEFHVMEKLSLRGGRVGVSLLPKKLNPGRMPKAEAGPGSTRWIVRVYCHDRQRIFT